MEGLCRDVLAKNPRDRWASATLCSLLCAANEHQQAIDFLREILAVDELDPYLHLNLAHCFIAIRQYRLAKVHAKRAAELEPADVKMWVNYSSASFHLEEFDEGSKAALKALELDPSNVTAMNNLGTIRMSQGRIPEAVEWYQKSLAVDSSYPTCFTNLLLVLLYDARATMEQVVGVAKRYAQQFEAPVVGQRLAHRNVVLPERRLKVGFISPDFTSHAVMYFAEPVLARLPREQFEVYCYFTYAAGDGVTERVKSHVDRFRYVPDTDPKKTAQMIQDDEVDILIDLAGHTAKNGLRAMAYKPAPVQVTWLGYPGTTGLSSIDWRITDHIADPPGADTNYTEKLIRLPGCFAVYRPHIRSQLHRFDPKYQVSPLPVLSNGYITFGSCNNIAKLSEQAIAAWSAILKRVAGSKILIEGKDLGREEATHKLRGMFDAHGVGADRLLFVQRDSAKQYLTYRDIDIALDPFPLTGGTTTFDTLWMGVPIVSLVGKTFRERISTTVLINGGFKEDLCQTVDAYVERAVALASDTAALAHRRSGQRAQMQASALMNEQRYVDLFGQSLRMAWRQWCQTQEPQGVRSGGLPAKGEDVLVVVNGKRITMPSALAWLQRLRDKIAKDNNPLDVQSAQAMALAILNVSPEQPALAGLLTKENSAS